MFIINDFELSRLEGQAHICTCVYIYLRRFMDYSSGIVGIKRGISYQSIGEALYIEPRAGVAGGSPHRSTIRRTLDQLQKSGLLERTGSGDFLIFKMRFATTDKNARKKADTISTPKADRAKPPPNKANSYEADMVKNTKADTPQSSEFINLYTPPNNNLHSTELSTEAGAGVEFSNIIKPEHQEAIKAYLKQVPANIHQTMIDDLTGFISQQTSMGKPVKSPAGIIRKMIERFKGGLYVPESVSVGRSIRKLKKPAFTHAPQSPAPKKPPPEGAQTALKNQIAKMKGKK